jgi:hypothetical protein
MSTAWCATGPAPTWCAEQRRIGRWRGGRASDALGVNAAVSRSPWLDAGLPRWSPTPPRGKLMAVLEGVRRVAFSVGVVSLTLAAPASAAGGLFARQSAPVHLAGEQILLADNGDGTTSAVIQIEYKGGEGDFVWLLPVPAELVEGDVAVAHNVAFERLNQYTSPRYYLDIEREGTCANPVIPPCALAIDPETGLPWNDAGQQGPQVSVPLASSRVVADVDWTVISVDASTPRLADAAIEWLLASGYHVPEETAASFEPYLSIGMNLLALRVRTDSDAGVVRPIAIRYPGKPAIPLRPTSLSGNDEMDLVVYVVGSTRAAPLNYSTLELNEARLNWKRPALSYDGFVSAAVREAGGQGFVTELSAPTRTLATPLGDVKPVWDAEIDAYLLRVLRETKYATVQEVVGELYLHYGQYQGFELALAAGISNLPPGMTVHELVACSICGSQDDREDCVPCPEGVELFQETIVRELEARIAGPMRVVQDLIDAGGWITRLYTVGSPAEMALDPHFAFNAELPAAVSNEHTARFIIECSRDASSTEAAWRMGLANGITVRGGPGPAEIWPAEAAALPANARIWRYGSAGQGQLVQDNLPRIRASLEVSEAGCSHAGRPPRGARGGPLAAAALFLAASLSLRRRAEAHRTRFSSVT